ncbi:hypothetical protein ANO11243_040840 [Dothideomycetidae sp. 11243]|nr:hypothetical protein ANO11243_040840 [fungal sp. No.11243]
MTARASLEKEDMCEIVVTHSLVRKLSTRRAVEEIGTGQRMPRRRKIFMARWMDCDSVLLALPACERTSGICARGLQKGSTGLWTGMRPQRFATSGARYLESAGRTKAETLNKSGMYGLTPFNTGSKRAAETREMQRQRDKSLKRKRARTRAERANSKRQGVQRCVSVPAAVRRRMEERESRSVKEKGQGTGNMYRAARCSTRSQAEGGEVKKSCCDRAGSDSGSSSGSSACPDWIELRCGSTKARSENRENSVAQIGGGDAKKIPLLKKFQGRRRVVRTRGMQPHGWAEARLITSGEFGEPRTAPY